MAAILTAQTTNNPTATGVSHTGPATVFVRGTFGGANVVIQVADENVAASFVKADNVAPLKSPRLDGPGCVNIEGKGTYFIRAVVANAGSTTSITAVSTQ